MSVSQYPWFGCAVKMYAGPFIDLFWSFHEIYWHWKKKITDNGCYQTCYIIKFSEVQFNVIPLHDYAAVGVWGGHRYKDVVFEGEDVRWYGLNGDGLMTHKVCEMRTKTETAGLLIKWKHQNLHTHSFSYISVLWEASFMYSGLLNLAFSLVIFYFWDCMFFNSHLQWP